VSETPSELTPDEQTQEQDGPEPDEATPVQPPSEEEEAAEEEQAQESEQVEGVPPEAQAVSQKQIEQVWKKFEKSSAVWRRRVVEIMEGDADVLMLCPLCDPLIPGYVMPAPDVPERFPAVREFMGDAQPAEYEQDPNTRTCQSCAGQGMVATGSKVQGQEQLVCTDCGGKGWQGQRAPIPTSGPMAVQPLPDANGQSEVTPQGPEPPEVAKLRAMGWTPIPPVVTS